MRADIHDGPEHMLQSEAGYIDARPLTPARQNLLQRTAGPYIGSKGEKLSPNTCFPLRLRQRTCGGCTAMTVSCQNRKLPRLASCSKAVYWRYLAVIARILGMSDIRILIPLLVEN